MISPLLRTYLQNKVQKSRAFQNTLAPQKLLWNMAKLFKKHFRENRITPELEEVLDMADDILSLHQDYERLIEEFPETWAFINRISPEVVESIWEDAINDFNKGSFSTTKLALPWKGKMHKYDGEKLLLICIRLCRILGPEFYLPTSSIRKHLGISLGRDSFLLRHFIGMEILTQIKAPEMGRSCAKYRVGGAIFSVLLQNDKVQHPQKDLDFYLEQSLARGMQAYTAYEAVSTLVDTPLPKVRGVQQEDTTASQEAGASHEEISSNVIHGNKNTPKKLPKKRPRSAKPEINTQYWTAERFLAEWNRIAKNRNFPRNRNLDRQLRTWVNVILHEFSQDDIQEAFHNLEKGDFTWALESGWFSFRWLVKNTSNFGEIVDGRQYHGNKKQGPGQKKVEDPNHFTNNRMRDFVIMENPKVRK